MYPQARAFSVLWPHKPSTHLWLPDHTPSLSPVQGKRVQNDTLNSVTSTPYFHVSPLQFCLIKKPSSYEQGSQFWKQLLHRSQEIPGLVPEHTQEQCTGMHFPNQFFPLHFLPFTLVSGKCCLPLY